MTVALEGRPHFTPGIDPVPILQEAGWDPGPVWTGGKSRPHRDLIPDCPAHSQSLCRLSYPAHIILSYCSILARYNWYRVESFLALWLWHCTVVDNLGSPPPLRLSPIIMFLWNKYQVSQHFKIIVSSGCVLFCGLLSLRYIKLFCSSMCFLCMAFKNRSN